MGEDRRMAVEGTAVDPDLVTAVAAAVKETASQFSYAGVMIGGYITDEQCRAVATAAIIAANNYKAAPSI